MEPIIIALVHTGVSLPRHLPLSMVNFGNTIPKIRYSHSIVTAYLMYPTFVQVIACSRRALPYPTCA